MSGAERVGSGGRDGGRWGSHNNGARLGSVRLRRPRGGGCCAWKLRYPQIIPKLGFEAVDNFKVLAPGVSFVHMNVPTYPHVIHRVGGFGGGSYPSYPQAYYCEYMY